VTLFSFNPNSKSHEDDFTKQKIGNRQLTEASSAKLTLEGEGDTFSFISNMKQCEIIANRTKAISQTKSQEPSTRFTKLTLDGKGDAFRFKLESCTKATYQTQKL
jgi:hypothetical protein